ncbi:SLC13 family permease [Mailhella massiliensis]|uniref:SLC13 family permease n=1 Tax=Mailhella massiliensis TaxID=1903261 RepID=A0A921AWE4_9BACT|nr:SLC13 family permease [Mailhella massiliensis]HJD97120.1 SLC13 family permease [Mailhella massiliensis]
MAATVTAPAAPKKPDIMYFVHSVICLAIMFGFGQLSPIEPLTPLGMNLIGVFLGVLYGWIFIDIIWPSIAGLLGLMLVGGMKPGLLLNKSFGDPIVVMMFFIFVFCATINYYGLSKFISLWFITRKAVAGKPWLFTYTFLGSIMLLGGLTSASPAAVIGWSILYGVCDVCGYKKGDGYPTMMVFGIVYAAQVGMALIPFKQAALTVMSAYETMSGTHIDYAKYMFIALVACALCSLLFLLIGKYIFRPDVSKLADLDANQLDKDQSLSLNKVQKMVLGFLFALVALLLIPAFLPGDIAVVKFLKSIGNTGICMFLVGVMCFIKVNGKPLLRFKGMVDDGVAWGIIFILAMVQPLSGAMAKPESGITPFLMTMLEPLFGSGSPLFFAVCMGLLATILTQFINNGAVGVALMPVIFSYCTNMGVGPELPVIMVVMGVHLAFLTPAASSSAALLHGNEWASTKSIWKSSPIVILLSWILMSAVVAILGSVIF